MENVEFITALYKCFADIAEKEKVKALKSENYGVAIVAAIFEGRLKQALLNLQV